MEYVVYTKLDWDRMGSFKTLKEAKDFIKELKRFDKENGNPFDEQYVIVKE